MSYYRDCQTKIVKVKSENSGPVVILINSFYKIKKVLFEYVKNFKSLYDNSDVE